MHFRGLVALGFLWLLALPGLAAAQSATISMTASSARVTVGEPFAIRIRADISGAEVDDLEVPDFGNLQVLGRSVSRPFSVSFGFGHGGQPAEVQSQIVHAFTLRATRPGTYAIKPAAVIVGKRRVESQPLRIEATGSALPSQSPTSPAVPDGTDAYTAQQDPSAPPDGPLEGAQYDQDAFLRTVIDKPKAVTGEQVTVTVYLYVRGGLSEAPAITREPTADGFWVQDLLAPNRALAPIRQEVNSRVFNAYVLRRFAAFALREGTLQIGATAIEIGGRRSIFDLLSGPSQSVRRTGIAVSVEIEPRPARKSDDVPSFVGELNLTADVDRNEARVGDAVTLRATLKGFGNLKSLTLPNPKVEGFETLTPEVEDEVDVNMDRVGGSRTFRWLLLARAPGAVTIPSLAVDVLDPVKRAYQRVATQPIALQVEGTAAAASASSPPDTHASRSANAPTFGAIRTQSALLRKREPLHHQGWFLGAVFAGPLAFGFASAVQAARKRLQRAHAGKRGERAFKDAQAALDAAQNAAHAGDSKTAQASIASALRAALEARLNEPVGGLTYPALRQHLMTRGMPAPLAERIVSQLEAGEASRFNPLSNAQDEFKTSLERSRGVVRELAKFTPGEAR